jgi:hypothetical protein
MRLPIRVWRFRGVLGGLGILLTCWAALASNFRSEKASTMLCGALDGVAVVLACLFPGAI